jgi:hypothetical protein
LRGSCSETIKRYVQEEINFELERFDDEKIALRYTYDEMTQRSTKYNYFYGKIANARYEVGKESKSRWVDGVNSE